jgi:hypothetical protein
MNTNYKVILECRQEDKMPIITPYPISKGQYDQIMKIVHDNNEKAHKKSYSHGRDWR